MIMAINGFPYCGDMSRLVLTLLTSALKVGRGRQHISLKLCNATRRLHHHKNWKSYNIIIKYLFLSFFTDLHVSCIEYAVLSVGLL
jgi:hypothetical protein